MASSNSKQKRESFINTNSEMFPEHRLKSKSKMSKSDQKSPRQSEHKNMLPLIGSDRSNKIYNNDASKKSTKYGDHPKQKENDTPRKSILKSAQSESHYENSTRKSVLPKNQSKQIENDDPRKDIKTAQSNTYVENSPEKSTFKTDFTTQNLLYDTPRKSKIISTVSKKYEGENRKSILRKQKTMDTEVKKNTSQSHTDNKLQYEKTSKTFENIIHKKTVYINAESKSNLRTKERSPTHINIDGTITDNTSKKSRHSKIDDNPEIKQSSYIKAESKMVETSPKKLKSAKEIHTDQLKIADPQSTVSESGRASSAMSKPRKSQTSKSSGLVEGDTVTPSVSLSVESPPSSGSTWTNFQPTSFYIDFTPNEDDERNYTKCMQFWDYIHSRKDLTDILVLPQEEKDECLLNKQTVHQIIEEQRRERENHLPENRLPVLKKFMELDDDMVKSAFLVRDCPKTCASTATGASDAWSPNCTDEAKKICKVMEEFDKTHPKSMEPPGVPPPMSHAEMQRCPDRIKF